MTYFKIDDNDYSKFVNQLVVSTTHKYTAQENAAGDTVVDYINQKRTFTIGIIPLDDATMQNLQADINKFNVSISFRNPKTGVLEENVNCIIPTNGVEYYTIQVDKVLYKTFTLTITEL